MKWLEYAKTAAATNGEANGSWVCEWKGVDILSHDLAAFKKDLSDLAADKLARSELAFLRENPNAVESELFLRACKPLLDRGIENADWHAIQETIRTSVKQFYLADLSQFGLDVIKPLLNDVYFCATARKLDEKEPLGFLLFAVTPALPFGDVKVINFFLKEEATGTDLRNILMGLIFKIMPETRRIFLSARTTDLAALEMYAAMGFKKDENPFQDPSHKIHHKYLVSLDYRIENSKILQEALKR